MQWTNRSRSGRTRVLCAIAVIVAECFLSAVIVTDGARSRLTQAPQQPCIWLLHRWESLSRFWPSNIVSPVLQPRRAFLLEIGYEINAIDSDWVKMRRLDLGIVTVYWARQ